MTNPVEPKNLHKYSVLYGLMLAAEHIEDSEKLLTEVEAETLKATRLALEDRIALYANQVMDEEAEAKAKKAKKKVSKLILPFNSLDNK